MTPRLPIDFVRSDDPILRRAGEAFANASGSVDLLVAQKIALARRYDVAGMVRAVAICYWSRSGTLLLASYLDNHPDVVMLPVLTSAAIYPFFSKYERLSIWEKLIAYAEYSGLMKINEGEFAIAAPTVGASDYFSAVSALFELYCDMPTEWLGNRQRFFQFLHVAYDVGIGRLSKNPRPVMIYAQHYVNQEIAELFIADFPRGQFIHTIRDPISGVDTWFDRQTQLELNETAARAGLPNRYLDPAVATMKVLLTWDCAHVGMEERSYAIRFEDMHLSPEATMRRLADTLELPYNPSLIESTWNGVPYVVEIRGVKYCGANPDNAKRRSKNLAVTDRLLVFALFHENFVAWNYPTPVSMNRRWIRLCVIALFSLFPMRIEKSTARLVVKQQALPYLRSGGVTPALGALVFLLKRRLRMIHLFATQTRARLSGYDRILKPL